MKYSVLKKWLCVIALITTLSIVGFAQSTDFTGDWKVNKQNSNAGKLSINSIPVELKISQASNEFKVERITTNVKAEIKSVKETIKLDGSVNEFAAANNQTKKSTIQWSADRTVLTETISYVDFIGQEMWSSKKTWRLENNGKTLHITAVLVEEDGKYQLEEYFDKQ